jgi:hypothetical protein
LAVSRQTVTRHTSLSRLIIGVTVLAAVIAIAPIVAAAFGISGQQVATRTAFASAPSGNYAVVSRTEGQYDIVAVAWAENPGAVTEVARVPHIDGMGATGSVSPDGTKVALVAVDAGTATRPVASLISVDLVTGELFRAALNIEPNQVPVWAPDSQSVVVTRGVASDTSFGAIQVLRVALRGTEDVLWTRDAALAVFPVGYEPSGSLIAVVIDGRGSTVTRDGRDALSLGTAITRDWQLSPDGDRLAYVEANTENGLRYLARTVSLSGASSVQAQSLSAEMTALGVAWEPTSGRPTFGVEPGQESGGVSAQALKADAGGFDVPLAYASDGSTLAVMRWSGESFLDAGSAQLELVDASGRAPIDDYTRFLGWARR